MENSTDGNFWHVLHEHLETLHVRDKLREFQIDEWTSIESLIFLKEGYSFFQNTDVGREKIIIFPTQHI